MNNKINQELQKIEFPKELHERSIMGVKKATAEQQKRKFKNPLVAAAIIIVLSTTSAAFAFPSIAAQIPFMDNVISFFYDEERDYNNFEAFSTEIGLAQTSNGTTVMIDNAVYDGTNITISFAIETEKEVEKEIEIRATNWFDVVGASGMGGSEKITKISDNHYVGLATFTPNFKNEEYPETVEITWNPEAFNSLSNDLAVEGDWSFAFSLNRLEGDVDLLNETVQNDNVNFTLKFVEFTDVSTIISYEQVISEELLKDWESVTPVFNVKDDLGNVYMNGTSGGGETSNDYKTFKGTSDFGTIQEGATKLFIQPIQIASLNSGKGHTIIELEPVVIELKK
ncbi:hypothetical protein CR203_18730 [Salipaludibacillus neizhouensis]|uniref:DUF4179 domain-containing protein n=1 Tax=Salipaludibacillus neizhouensis TaxID=885475 RepID=A0A3A9KMB6_9BACI|nr:DUF4179 domain-containing protein [Salipaludibacillus neizhouensis]RKL65886.1 hypothetical protein CR203_18730 [Salipaludibacillus neizhouensis]